MHVAVMGAGVVGITTAYYLLEQGHDVTVIDRESDVAGGCSFANGAQLSYSFVDAMASPSFLARIPGLLAGAERAIRIRPPLDRNMLRWGSAFLAECTASRAEANSIANLQLARQSRALLAELREQLPDAFAFRNAGKLVLLGKPRDVANARRASEMKAQFECNADVVTIDEAIAIEPAIQHMTGEYSGAVWSPGDDVADARRFTRELAAHIEARRSCRMQFDTSVTSLVAERGRIREVVTDRGSIAVDAAVVCLGVRSPALLQPLGINLPIVPARGYSVTLATGAATPSVSVTDFSSRFVISQIGEQVRIAGFADFVGFKTTRDAQRIQELWSVAESRAPQAATYSAAEKSGWGGLRPLTPNGQPIIGPSDIDGLYLNTGHGSFGWTLACASGERVAAQISSGEVAALAA